MSFLYSYIAYTLGAFFILIAGLALCVFSLYKKFKTIFRGDKGDLDAALVSLRESENAHEKRIAEAFEKIIALEKGTPKNIKKVGLVRYNPFSDAGGDQSFALALLNELDDGIVISSLYGREVNRVYAKQVEHGTSKYKLSDEETQAIQNAK